MKKITLKIIQKIANKNNTDISEFFALFMAAIATNEEFEKILKNYELDKKEKEILRDFFEYLKDCDKNEFIKNFIEVTYLNKTFKNLALFFTVFIPENILLSKNPKKIKDSLKIYPLEIQEAIIKSLEMLSLADMNIEKEIKLKILKEVINTIILLTHILGELNVR